VAVVSVEMAEAVALDVAAAGSLPDLDSGLSRGTSRLPAHRLSLWASL